MKEPSNLPPGVTDRMVEEQAGGFKEKNANEVKYDKLFKELKRAIDEEEERYAAAWSAPHGGDGVMLESVPPPDEDAIARRVVTEPLTETSLVAIIRYARALGEWGEGAEDVHDEQREHYLNVACLLSWRLAVQALLGDREARWGSDPEKEIERYLSRLFSRAAFQDDDDQQV